MAIVDESKVVKLVEVPDDGTCKCEEPEWHFVSGEEDVGIPNHYVCLGCGGMDRRDREPPSDPEEEVCS